GVVVLVELEDLLPVADGGVPAAEGLLVEVGDPVEELLALGDVAAELEALLQDPDERLELALGGVEPFQGGEGGGLVLLHLEDALPGGDGAGPRALALLLD